MKTLLLDMYGVIIKESKGNFMPYTYAHFPHTDKASYRKLYVSASRGEISCEGFLTALGFANSASITRDYVENHLTLDAMFCDFAERFAAQYDFVLLSNDIAEWSVYIRKYHDLDRYFKAAIVSANIGLRKPDVAAFQRTIELLGVAASDCIFVDNSVENLRAAESVGMDTVLFNRDGEEYGGKIVNSFAELRDILI